MPLFRSHPRPSSNAEQCLIERLKGHVDVFAGLIGPRYIEKPTALDAAATYIHRQFTDIGDTVIRQPYRVGAADVVNLIVERRGTRCPEQIVVIGAHYDTVPATPGADDNASAVAMLIEAARLLQPVQTKRTLRFVSFTCEEPPHFYTDSMGSQYYARACRRANECITGMICLEMVGYYSTRPASQQIPPAIPRWLQWAFPRRGDFLAAVGNLRSFRLLWSFRRGFKRGSLLPLYSVALPERLNEIRLSDNSSFWDQGYPALMITDTGFLRNPNYHSPTDTPDTLDYTRLAQATLGTASAIARVGRSTMTPHF